MGKGELPETTGVLQIYQMSRGCNYSFFIWQIRVYVISIMSEFYSTNASKARTNHPYFGWNESHPKNEKNGDGGSYCLTNSAILEYGSPLKFGGVWIPPAMACWTVPCWNLDTSGSRSAPCMAAIDSHSSEMRMVYIPTRWGPQDS